MQSLAISDPYNPLKASPAPIFFNPPEITPTYMVEMLGIQAYFSTSIGYTFFLKLAVGMGAYF